MSAMTADTMTSDVHSLEEVTLLHHPATRRDTDPSAIGAGEDIGQGGRIDGWIEEGLEERALPRAQL